GLWEYRYPNLFLVPSTQVVLAWLATLNTPLTKALFDATLQQSIPNPQERSAIFAVLSSHHLITDEQDLVRVTPKGREYLQFRRQTGWGPPLSPPAPTGG